MEFDWNVEGSSHSAKMKDSYIYAGKMNVPSFSIELCRQETGNVF